MNLLLNHGGEGTIHCQLDIRRKQKVIGLVQRVTQASVSVGERISGEINAGMLALIGVEKTDNDEAAAKLAEKLLSYRIFADQQGRMNLSLRDAGGGLLLVPQFTLVADTGKGLRPSFTRGAAPDDASALFDRLVAEVAMRHQPPAVGVFGADMQVSLCNDGPVTFWLQV